MGCSAVDTLLLPVNALLDADRGVRIFAQDLAERSAGRLLLAQGGERLAEPQQRVRRLGAGTVFGRDREEGFGRIVVFLIVKQTFAEPILRVRRQPIARIFLQEVAERLRRRSIVLLHHVAVSEIVFVFRRGVGWQRRLLGIALHGAGRARIDQWRRRQGAALRNGQIERRAGLLSATDI